MINGPGGLFQWKGSRQTPEVARLVNSGNWKGQIDYALKEDVGPQYKGATANMSAHEASMWWAKYWERPASLTNADKKHSQYLSGYKFQSGGLIGGSPLQPVMVESGEKIFAPGSYGPEIKALNEEIPRFQSGGLIGGSPLQPVTVKPKEPVPRFQSGGSVVAPRESIPKFQSGGSVVAPRESIPKFQSGGSVVELRESIPKFESGGSVNVSSVVNPIHNIFQQANRTKMDSDSQGSQPIIIPVPQPVATSSGGGGMSNDNVSGSYVPSLPNEPSNHIISTLMMQTYSLMNRIG